MKRKKPINLDYIKKIEPLTDNQEYSLTLFKRSEHGLWVLNWKTFIALYPLLDVLDVKSSYEKIYIVRSQDSPPERLIPPW